MLSPLSIGHPTSALPRRRGFALLITITLVAFLVLILVTLASLTRVETQVATNSQTRDQARQNALMALNIAIGQLQKYTGPDQRVTAAADIASAADGTRLAAGGVAQNTHSVNGTGNGLSPSGAPSVQTGTRWWTGVWGRAGTGYATPAKSIYEETPSPVLLNWLVSGNENRAFTVDSDGWVRTSSNNGATAADTAPFTPGAPVDWTAAGLNPATPAAWVGSAGYADLEIKTSGQKAVLLVGPNTAGTDPVGGENASERYVVAPLQDITVPSSSIGMGTSGDSTIGRYAWWVGDEGTKAAYSISDPHAGKNNPDAGSTAGAEARLRLMSASRSGIELVAGWQDYPGANDSNAAVKLGRVIDLSQAPMLTSSLTTQTQRAGFHDFTRMSNGLMTDTLNGGLRRDLTYYFEQSSLPSPLAGQGIIPAPYSPSWGSGNLAPKWDWLYSFYNTNPSVTSPSMDVRGETGTQVGISPIITQFRMIVFTDAAATLQSTPNLKYLNIDTDYQLPVRCNVVFVLANPYNFTLTAPANSLEFTIDNNSTRSAQNSMQLIGGSPRQEYLILGAPINDADKAGGLLDVVRFLLPPISIPPGESITLSVSGNGQVASSSNLVKDEPTNTINLAVNNGSNPVRSTNYFSGGGTFDFTTTSSNRIAVLAQKDIPTFTTSLRDTGTHKVYHQIYDAGVSKNATNGLSSLAGTVFGSTQVRMIAPAQRNLDWSTSDQKTTLALFNYGRLYQDFNIRASVVAPPNVTPGGGNQVNLTPANYAGGLLYRLSSGNENLIFNEFTQELHPAPWAENFGQMNSAPTINLRSGEAASGIFYDFPRRASGQLPVMSMGQLQHASVTTDDQHPDATAYHQSAYTIGNSYHNPYVTRGSSIQSRTNVYSQVPSGNSRYFDLSYLLNTALWDGYFFSGIPQSGAGHDPLNARYRLDDDASASDARSPASAAKLTVQGAFNINSTSKDAWVAFLGGLNGLRVNDDTTADGVPYPRTLWQPEHSTSTSGSYQTSGSGDNAYAGYRRLTPADLDRLATEIVKRVRARGPFVSLSQFINRTLVAASGDFNPNLNDADTAGNLASPTVPMGRGFAGTLQAAIDSEASGINTYQTVGGVVVTADGAGNYGDRVLFNGEIVPSLAYKPNNSNTQSVYFADKTVDAPHTEWDINVTAKPGPNGRTSTGTPGWLMQGDILQAVAPALSARSDTFVIRTYGEVLNPVDPTQKLASVWCEALVQRQPDYVDDTDAADAAPGSLSTTNQNFGRAYKVVGFRWLSPDDI